MQLLNQTPKRSRPRPRLALFLGFAVILFVSIGSSVRLTGMLNGYAGIGIVEFDFDFDDPREQAPTKIVSMTTENATVDAFETVTVITGGNNNTLDNNNNNNNNNNNYERATTIRKPQLILHIGPSKVSGTSEVTRSRKHSVVCMN